MTKQKIIKFSAKEFMAIEEAFESFMKKGDKSNPPLFRAICGPPGSGKTRYRREKYEKGFVVIDEGDITKKIWPLLTSEQKYVDFIGWMTNSLIREAIRERKNIMIEVLLNEEQPLKMIMDKMKDLGYQPEVELIHNDLEKCLENNEKRGKDNISAYYSQDNLFQWLLAYFREKDEEAKSVV